MTDAADRNAHAIQEAHGSFLECLIREARLILTNVHLSNKSKRHHLTRVATEFSDFIKPLTACRNECSHCCNMATAVSQEEADIIGDYIKTTPQPVVFDMLEFYARKGYTDIYTGVPCTFLVEGRCSIYPVRPIACRLHHSLEDTPDPCKMDSVKEVGVFNIYAIHNAYITCTNVMADGGAIGDIRQFFPAPIPKTLTEPTGDYAENWP